ncbi:glycosyltransferase [Lichenicoccus sp.]|uniref:glycosyltransferase n=1 Tax=Lichenicoccus sp. TaxID=2781899 RepID=UPI003D0DA91C
MKIAHIMAGADAGGAELFYERLAAAQHAAGHQVLPVMRANPARARRLRAERLEPCELRFGGRLDLLTGPRLRRALRRFQPRVAVAWMNRAARLAPAGDWVLAGRLGGYYDLSYYRSCDHLIGNTLGIVDWIRAQGWPAARVHHLPNFADDHAMLARVRPDWLAPGSKLVLALGRLHRNKAFDVLIRALAGVPDAVLVIAGEGPERGALEALARQIGVASRLRMPGWSDDPRALLAGADLLVCPSRHEPLGNVVIEAFSARLPVVAASVAGPVELISSGEDGILVPPEDVPALAAAIGAVLGDAGLAARLAAAGRRKFERNFARAPVLARWDAVLSGLEHA